MISFIITIFIFTLVMLSAFHKENNNLNTYINVNFLFIKINN